MKGGGNVRQGYLSKHRETISKSLITTYITGPIPSLQMLNSNPFISKNTLKDSPVSCICLPLFESRIELSSKITPRLSELVPSLLKLVPSLLKLVPSLCKLVPSQLQ